MFCPKCGKENLDTSKFCKACGKNLPDRAQIRQALSQNYAIPQTANLIGQVLDGRYRIEARLGAGGMGDVYRATRLLIGDVVAIKILHAHLASNPQAAERFRHEAVTATKLRHRNVVALYDVGISTVHNVPYILMELAEGLTLRQIINHSKILPLDFAVTVIAQICAGLDEAHHLGIVHRDIKPENIIANQTPTGWHVKVLDFGIAKLYNEANSGLTQDGSAMGTPQYMSPEQCMGEPLNASSDIYSVGIVLYEMLCGTVPFKHAAASAIAIYQVQMPPQPPRSINPAITPEVEAVILRALSKQRDARPQTVQAFSQEFIRAATLTFKAASAPTIYAAPATEKESAQLRKSAIFTKPKPIETPAELPKEKSAEENLPAAIPKPVADVLPTETKKIDSKTAEIEESGKDLKDVFEDAEFILDEILADRNTDDLPDLPLSQPINKPSEPLFSAINDNPPDENAITETDFSTKNK
ncbi:hypothetical protein BH10ACI1_BH10ACI1_05990 [soil metagenome]